MFSAAFDMFVCGWPGPLYPREKTPSIADTLTTYLRRAAAASIAGRSRLTRMNGAVWLQSWTSSSSRASTSPTVATQLFVACVSGTSPPASIAVPATRRVSEAASAVSARVATSPTPICASASESTATEPASARGCASLVWP